MNIILNSYCNLKCNYCFADEYMEETVNTPGKSMDFDFFTEDVLPRVKTASLINFMGGEPTLHPRFNEILSSALENMQPFSFLGIFTNALPEGSIWHILLCNYRQLKITPHPLRTCKDVEVDHLY